MRTELGLSAIGLVVLSSTVAPAQDPLAAQLAALEEQYRDSLVEIRYTQQVRLSTAEPPEEAELTTTGVVVSVDGMVMVSAIIYEPFNHVPHGVGIRFPGSVTRAEATISEARIRLTDGSEHPASLLGRDPEADVGFFRIDAERSFRPVVFDVEATADVGQQVAVLSFLPEPVGPSLVVELTRVQAMTARPPGGFLVTTGAADPVGALVVSLDGRVLGMLDAVTVSVPVVRSRNPLAVLSMMRSLPKGIGRGYARPSRLFVDATVRIPEEDPVRRGWLGIEMQALSPELAAHLKLPVEEGIILGYVYRDSPAEKAGLEVGDIVVDLDGEPIRVQAEDEIGTFAEAVLRAGVGARLELGYLRKGERGETAVTLEPAPRSVREAETLEVDELDLTVRELTYDFRATRFLEPEQDGVVVVKPPISVSGNPNRIVPGDLLVRLGEDSIRDLASLSEAMDRLRGQRPDAVLVFVERGRESFFFAMKPEWN